MYHVLFNRSPVHFHRASVMFSRACRGRVLSSKTVSSDSMSWWDLCIMVRDSILPVRDRLSRHLVVQQLKEVRKLTRIFLRLVVGMTTGRLR